MNTIQSSNDGGAAAMQPAGHDAQAAAPPRRAPSAARVRLLECWLPLAAEVSRASGWALDHAALEALVRRAARRLELSRSAAEARATLEGYYERKETWL